MAGRKTAVLLSLAGVGSALGKGFRMPQRVVGEGGPPSAWPDSLTVHRGHRTGVGAEGEPGGDFDSGYLHRGSFKSFISEREKAHTWEQASKAARLASPGKSASLLLEPGLWGPRWHALSMPDHSLTLGLPGLAGIKPRVGLQAATVAKPGRRWRRHPALQRGNPPGWGWNPELPGRSL